MTPEIGDAEAVRRAANLAEGTPVVMDRVVAESLVAFARDYADVLERFLLIPKDAPSITLAAMSNRIGPTFGKPAGRYYYGGAVLPLPDKETP